MNRYLRVLTALLAVLLTLAPATATAQESSPISNVTPSVGPPGARFAFMARGFADDEQVGVWVNTPGGAPMAIEAEELNSADGDGRADWYWTAPTDAQPGIWQMVARGIDSRVEHVIPFEIRGDTAPPALTTNVTPSVGPPGARFAFVARGFEDDEQVGVWVNTPGGTPMASEAEELNSADGDGRADWYWTAPTDAQPGIWQMVAQGVDSGVEHVIPFEIRLP